MLNNLSKSQVAAIADRVLAMLAQGVAPWRKPWAVGSVGPFNPLARVNGKQGHAFSGLNAWVAMLAGAGKSRYWATPKQWMAQRVKIAGASTIPMLFPRFVENRETKKKTLVGFGSYAVMNASDIMHHAGNAERIAAIIAPFEARDGGAVFTPIEQAEQLVARIAQNIAPFVTGETAAFYNPKADSIGLPTPATFTQPADFYSTLFHEATHSTGHNLRLARPGVTEPTRFGSHAYSREELTAEFGACFLVSQCGIDHTTIDNSAAYLDSWTKRIKHDPTVVTAAIEDAYNAYRWMVGEHPTQKEPA
jgi:antirestriction protein ArdC